MQGAGDQVGLSAAVANFQGLCRCLQGTLVVARSELLLKGRQQKVALLGAIGSAFQKPLRAGEPAGRRACLSSAGETEAQPECGADGARAFALSEIGMMAPLQRPQALLVAVAQVGRHRETLEVSGPERVLPIGACEDRQGIAPGASLVGLTPLSELKADRILVSMVAGQRSLLCCKRKEPAATAAYQASLGIAAQRPGTGRSRTEAEDPAPTQPRASPVTEDGGAMEASGMALVVWKLEADGVWRMSQDIWNADQ
jgi:hypothetical protein